MKILGHILIPTRNRTATSAAGARDHNHHATHQCCTQNYCNFYIPIRAENAVKLSSKVSEKMEEKIRQERGGYRVGDTMRTKWDVGGINDEKTSCDEVKNFQGCCSV